MFANLLVPDLFHVTTAILSILLTLGKVADVRVLKIVRDQPDATKVLP